MIVKWEQPRESPTEGGRQGKEGSVRKREEVNVITLSLVHCCLLSDLIWSRRHTWAKAHPSQVLQDPSVSGSLSSSFHSSNAIFLHSSLWFLHLFFQARSPSICLNPSTIRCLHVTLFQPVWCLRLCTVCTFTQRFLALQGILVPLGVFFSSKCTRNWATRI